MKRVGPELVSPKCRPAPAAGVKTLLVETIVLNTDEMMR